jgi:hypothetical protein
MNSSGNVGRASPLEMLAKNRAFVDELLSKSDEEMSHIVAYKTVASGTKRWPSKRSQQSSSQCLTRSREDRKGHVHGIEVYIPLLARQAPLFIHAATWLKLKGIIILKQGYIHPPIHAST